MSSFVESRRPGPDGGRPRAKPTMTIRSEVVILESVAAVEPAREAAGPPGDEIMFSSS